MTDERKKQIYAALSAPFPPEAIQRTDGRETGRGYSTSGISQQFIANRLNDVSDSAGSGDPHAVCSPRDDELGPAFLRGHRGGPVVKSG